jgi:molecular chaperone HtpG
VGEFDGKPFQDVARGDLGLETIEGAPPAPPAVDEDPALQALFTRVGAALGEQVSAVRTSRRLAESPSCLTRSDDELSEQMRRVLAAAGRGDLPSGKPVLELNATHPLVQRLEGLPDEEFGELSQLLYDQARLTEQGQLDNPGEYARRLNRLLLKLLK